MAGRALQTTEKSLAFLLGVIRSLRKVLNKGFTFFTRLFELLGEVGLQEGGVEVQGIPSILEVRADSNGS